MALAANFCRCGGSKLFFSGGSNTSPVEFKRERGWGPLSTGGWNPKGCLRIDEAIWRSPNRRPELTGVGILLVGKRGPNDAR
jgi:hypothetical protein